MRIAVSRERKRETIYMFRDHCCMTEHLIISCMALNDVYRFDGVGVTIMHAINKFKF